MFWKFLFQQVLNSKHSNLKIPKYLIHYVHCVRLPVFCRKKIKKIVHQSSWRYKNYILFHHITTRFSSKGSSFTIVLSPPRDKLSNTPPISPFRFPQCTVPKLVLGNTKDSCYVVETKWYITTLLQQNIRETSDETKLRSFNVGFDIIIKTVSKLIQSVDCNNVSFTYLYIRTSNIFFFIFKMTLYT